jgi:hypothetical protein
MTDATGKRRWTLQDSEPIFQLLEATFAEGQRAGIFTDFDARVMAVTMNAAMDGMVAYHLVHPEADVVAFAEQLGELLVRAMTARRGDPDRA